MKRVLHISHTDIRSDSRILKEMLAISKLSEFKLFGLGINRFDGQLPSKSSEQLSINTKKILALKFKFLPSTLRYFFEVCELSLIAFIEIIKIKPHIVHCHDVNPLPLVTLMSFLIKYKIIYDAHELESDRNGISKTNGRLVKFIEKICWKRINSFITVSESVGEWYLNEYGTKDVTIIYNAPLFDKEDRELANLNKDYFRTKYNIKHSKLVGVYVGIFQSGRGIEKLIRLYEKLNNDFHLIFLGYGTDIETVKSASKENTNIHYHEKIDHNKVVSILSSADIGYCLLEEVSLSDYYSLPNKIFEYMNAGLFCISCDFPEIKKTIEPDHGKAFNQNLDGVESFLMDNKNYLLETKNNFNLDNKFTWSSQTSKLSILYRHLSEGM